MDGLVDVILSWTHIDVDDSYTLLGGVGRGVHDESVPEEKVGKTSQLKLIPIQGLDSVVVYRTDSQVQIIQYLIHGWMGA